MACVYATQSHSVSEVEGDGAESSNEHETGNRGMQDGVDFLILKEKDCAMTWKRSTNLIPQQLSLGIRSPKCLKMALERIIFEVIIILSLSLIRRCLGAKQCDCLGQF